MKRGPWGEETRKECTYQGDRAARGTTSWEETGVSNEHVRKLSPFSQERLRVHLLENHGRKIPTKGETLAISGPSEGERASQDYKPQDKQTSQSGSPVLKPQS